MSAVPTCVVFISLCSTGEQLSHRGSHRLGGASQILSTLLQLEKGGGGLCILVTENKILVCKLASDMLMHWQHEHVLNLVQLSPDSALWGYSVSY